MQLDILTDIFGKTHAVGELVNSIERPCTVISPYADNRCFDNEQIAYRYFSEQIGIEHYYQRTLDLLQKIEPPYLLIGFSVGAAIAWRLSADNTLKKRPGNIIAFYGGQIRHFAHLNPLQPTELIFPKTEAHFCLESLVTALQNKATITRTPYLHGFMNPLSTHYSPQGYKKFLRYIKGLFDLAQ